MKKIKSEKRKQKKMEMRMSFEKDGIEIIKKLIKK